MCFRCGLVNHRCSSKCPRYVFALKPRNLGEGANTAVNCNVRLGRTTHQSKDLPRHDCHFLPIHRNTSRDITTGRIVGLKAGNCHCSTLPMPLKSLVPRVRQCWMCATSVFSPDCQAWHSTTQVLRHDLSTVVAILFTLTRFTEERSSLCFRDDWKLSSPSHLPALNQQRTLHNTRSIEVHDGCRFHVGIFDRDDRLIHPILCCTDGAVQKQPYHPKEPPGHTRRCTESVPPVQVFPLQLVTLDLSLSPASLQLVFLKLSLSFTPTCNLSFMPASLISRSTRSISALPSSEYITQGNMKICSHSPHLSKNRSLQWNHCGTCSASPLPLPHPTSRSMRMTDTRVGFPMVPKDPKKCEEFKCSCNSIKLKTCFADSFMRVNSTSRHNCLKVNL